MAELFFNTQALQDYVCAITQLIHAHPWITCICFYIFGTCVGSFLNVLALRSLKEESVLWPSSYCPNCMHNLAPWDNIPVISYTLLGGRCRYCRVGISWQYPFVEVCTGLLYAAVAYVFVLKRIPLENFDSLRTTAFSIEYTRDLFQSIQHGKHLVGTIQSLDSPELWFYKYGLVLGCLAFTSTLVAVCITDFREKLIPHEITYPSMLVGIAFSALIRGDILGTMAGIGASYIIFDFMAFYGRYPYIWMNMFMQAKENKNKEVNKTADTLIDRSVEAQDSTGSQASAPELELAQENSAETIKTESSAEKDTVKENSADQNQTNQSAEGPAATENADAELLDESEEIEVMGGGDAVLSAVMSAYLGWQGLVLALIIGFISGAVMGLVYLAIEMKKAGILKECGQKSLIFAIAFGSLMAGFTYFMMSGLSSDHEALIKTTMNSFLMCAVAGALLGMILVGTRVSKPFPFGPALALGGLIAMFLIPYWLPFY